MRCASIILALLALLAPACSGTREPASPKETFQTYVKALSNNDTKTMRLLLSSETVKMHEQEAKSQNVTLDDILKRETLFTAGQKVVEYKDEKIEGDKATLQVKNSYGIWETVPFIRENGEWKIDKKGYADQMMQEIEQNDQRLDDIINQGRQP
jgi:hypothetical protein